MMADLTPLTYTWATASAATGLSVTTIRAAVRAGDLAAHYPLVGGRPITRLVILASDLLAWVAGAPTERAS